MGYVCNTVGCPMGAGPIMCEHATIAHIDATAKAFREVIGKLILVSRSRETFQKFTNRILQTNDVCIRFCR